MTFAPDMPHVSRRGLMLILSSPSGAGKSTIAQAILEQDNCLELSVSVTTRSPRPGEIDGVHYHFRTHTDVEAMVAAGGFLEHAQVFDNHYGTPREPVEKALAAGKDVLFDIDWQGARQLTEKAANDVVRIFILPPSLSELERRLRGRGQDPDEVVRKRMAKASSEMEHWAEYDYVLVNTDLDASIRAVRSILEAERLKRSRQKGMETFVAALRGL
ncbi:guanylate kinase [Haematospirillum jordaniae]|uniref:Guanylate kinase n=1 Tax=Haematospirillum jordaniae TaxID=1549855 RepID=A0A143DB27_9PROT|nr:guanylate kinase [Haematospirillum jordaniae]AMW33902.1 guanylate kinase [Haematospirillum jordaniae]